MKALFIISILLLLGVALYALYAVLFFGWVLATPLTDAQAIRARFDVDVWHGVLLAAVVGIWFLLFGV